MSEPFLGEIRMVGFNFAPRSWASCDGQFLPINQNPSLYSILGTTYGGDGETTFALPDLRGRTPIHSGNQHGLGRKGGQEEHELTLNEMPRHTHAFHATCNSADSVVPTDNVPAATTGSKLYRGGGALAPLNIGSTFPTGQGKAHNNMQPYTVLHFVIALQGLFPSRN